MRATDRLQIKSGRIKDRGKKTERPKPLAHRSASGEGGR